MNIKVNLLETATGKLIEGEISRLQRSEFRLISNRTGFSGFDWRKEGDYEIYKVTLAGDERILGLMSVEDIPHEFRLHIRLLQVNAENKGSNKKIDYIIGCLIALACDKAFKEFPYGGFVSLVPKTRLIKHYETKYGFQQFGRQMAVLGAISRSLIKKYLKDV